MEGVGDACFRKAIASVGGLDEAVQDFIRVPIKAHIPSLSKAYRADEISPIPLAAQIMGSDTHLMAEMAVALALRGAPRIDINCGCPSNTVTGKGAGSSLLKDPKFLNEVAKSVVEAVSIPVTLKMRSGYEDTSLFTENLLAAQESGVRYISIHPRTKVEGYGPPAKWELIAQAKEILSIPVVGNGDIVTVEDALNILKMTRCDGLMIGRGAIMNPFIFHQIKSHFANKKYQRTQQDLIHYFHTYLTSMSRETPLKNQIGKLKQLLGFFFKGNERLLEHRKGILASRAETPQALLEQAYTLYRDTNL